MEINTHFVTALTERAFIVSLVRYLVVIVPVFLLTYVIFGRALRARRIQGRDVDPRQVGRELGLSISSCLVFALVDLGVTILSIRGLMHLQLFAPTPGPLAFAGYVVILLIIHDAYFYWSHRFMHWGPMFRLTHATHHRSISPTPFATYGFHPFEAFIQYGYVPVCALVMRVPLMPLFVVGIVMTVMNAVGHLGIELYPRWFVRNPIGRYLITATHHDLHHSTVRYNFGFYTNVWDRLMGTNHPDYEQEFERAASGAPRRVREALASAQRAAG